MSSEHQAFTLLASVVSELVSDTDGLAGIINSSMAQTSAKEAHHQT